MIIKDRRAPRDKRHHRLRRYVRGSAARPRLAVFRSLNHIYAQLVDDDAGRTLVAVDSRRFPANQAVDLGCWFFLCPYVRLSRG